MGYLCLFLSVACQETAGVEVGPLGGGPTRFGLFSFILVEVGYISPFPAVGPPKRWEGCRWVSLDGHTHSKKKKIRFFCLFCNWIPFTRV